MVGNLKQLLFFPISTLKTLVIRFQFMKKNFVQVSINPQSSNHIKIRTLKLEKSIWDINLFVLWC